MAWDSHSLYLVALPGMELFEEALQKWEQALTIRQRDSASTSTPVPWDSKKQQESMSENIPEVGPHFSLAFTSWATC